MDALLFLAHFHIRGRDLHTASLYCNRLLDMGGRVRRGGRREEGREGGTTCLDTGESFGQLTPLPTTTTQQEQEEAKALLREIRSLEGHEEEEEGDGERRESIGAFPVFENEDSSMHSSFSSTAAPGVATTPDMGSSGSSSRRMTRQQAAAAAAARAAALAGGGGGGGGVGMGQSPEC